jgi:ornithine racemase
MDAFGDVPKFIDVGVIERGILAIGRQDVMPENLTPID